LLDQSTVVQLPISEVTNAANETGIPFCLARPADAITELSSFRKLAIVVSEQLLKYQHGYKDDEKFVVFGNEIFDVSTATISIDKSRGGDFTVRLFSDTGAVQKHISSAKLRSRDPKTGDEISGSPFLSPASLDLKSDVVVTVHTANRKLSPSLVPTRAQRKGRYGFSVEWADGATIIYSTTCIAKAAGAVLI
jgi:hypothetical protein